MSGPLVQLEIEKLVYGGDGLARLPADEKGRRMAALIPFTLPGEQIEAKIISRKGGLARGEARAWATRSPQRTDPPCPYFGTCGGCHLQHGSYELQVAAKRDILRETFARAGLGEMPEIEAVSAGPWAYRNRIRVQVRHAPQWQVGYLQRRTHLFLPIVECPIAAPLLQRVIRIVQLPEASACAPAGLAELEMFTNHDQSELLFAASINSAPPANKSLQQWFEACREQLPELRGIASFAAGARHEEFRQAGTVGAAQIVYRAAGEDFRVSAGSFFQTNLFLLDALAQRVTRAVPDENLFQVLDLYAGVGLFSKLLARRGATVTAVESSPSGSADLKENLRDFPSAQVVSMDVERFLAKMPPRPGAVVVDPPRAGLGDNVTRQLARTAAPVLVYLSCDPATMARDLKALLASGYKAERLEMIDMFPQTFHIETLAVLRHN